MIRVRDEAAAQCHTNHRGRTMEMRVIWNATRKSTSERYVPLLGYLFYV